MNSERFRFDLGEFECVSISDGTPRHRDRVIVHSGYHFAVCDNLGMPGWVVALTPRRKVAPPQGWLVVP